MRRHFLLPLFAFLAVASIVPARGDDAASAKQVFDSLYGPKLKQVAGTIDRADDLTLAKDMLGVAKTSTSTPALLALLCESAHDLGMKHADGYATAAEAMSLLADTVAEKRAAARDKLVAVLTKQSTAGKPDERDAAGEKLIDTLLVMGDEKMEAKKWSEAASDYRKALATASTRKSAKLETAKASLDAAMYRDRTEKQVARLQEKILKDATDSASAEELVRLYLLDLDDAAAARPYLDRVKDAKLSELASLAAKEATALSESESLELGEWFAANAEKTPAMARRGVQSRAEVLLERFLSLHSANDSLRIKAQVRLTDVQKAMEEHRTTKVVGAKREPGASSQGTGNGGERRLASFVAPDRSTMLQPFSHADGTLETITVDGRKAIRSSGWFIYFELNDDFATNLQAGNKERFAIRLTVFDAVKGKVRIDVDSHQEPNSVFWPTADQELKGTGKWIELRFEITNARFNNRQQNRGDFRVATVIEGFAVSQVTVERLSVGTTKAGSK